MSTHSRGRHQRAAGTIPAMRPTTQHESGITLFPMSATVFVWLKLESYTRECMVTSVIDSTGAVRSSQSHLLAVGTNYLRIYVGYLEPGEYSIRAIRDDALYRRTFSKISPALH